MTVLAAQRGRAPDGDLQRVAVDVEAQHGHARAHHRGGRIEGQRADAVGANAADAVGCDGDGDVAPAGGSCEPCAVRRAGGEEGVSHALGLLRVEKMIGPVKDDTRRGS